MTWNVWHPCGDWHSCWQRCSWEALMPLTGIDASQRHWYPWQGLYQGMMSLSRGQQPTGSRWRLWAAAPRSWQLQEGSGHPHGKPNAWASERDRAGSATSTMLGFCHCDCLMHSHKELGTQILCQPFGINFHNYWAGVLAQRYEERLRYREQERKIVLDECQRCLYCTRFFYFPVILNETIRGCKCVCESEGVSCKCKLVCQQSQLAHASKRASHSWGVVNLTWNWDVVLWLGLYVQTRLRCQYLAGTNEIQYLISFVFKSLGQVWCLWLEAGLDLISEVAEDLCLKLFKWLHKQKTTRWSDGAKKSTNCVPGGI